MNGLGEAVAPQETLEAIRAIDPNADLVHMGGAEWLLGVREPNPAARARINRQLKTLFGQRGRTGDPLAERRIGREIETLQFYASGFKPIMLYELGSRDPDGEPITFGWIVDDFRVRDFNYRVRPKEDLADIKDAISLDAGNRRRAELMREYAEAEGPSLFRYAMKRARSFIQRVAIPGG